MSKLNQFLIKLGSDARMLLAMKQYPRKLMLDNGLTRDEMNVILAQDIKKLNDMAGGKTMIPILLIHGFA
jgi:hypothetical protein